MKKQLFDTAAANYPLGVCTLIYIQLKEQRYAEIWDNCNPLKQKFLCFKHWQRRCYFRRMHMYQLSHMQNSLSTLHPLSKGSPGHCVAKPEQFIAALLGHSRWTFLLINIRSTIPCLCNTHWSMNFCIPEDVKALQKNLRTPRDLWC